jgi:hypothetical protein
MSLFPYPVKPSLVDCSPEDVTGWPSERLSLDDLLGARGLAGEDDVARGVAAWADGHAVAREPMQSSMIATLPA